jgi:hypothetical protein
MSNKDDDNEPIVITRGMWRELKQELLDLSGGQTRIMDALTGNSLGNNGLVPTQADHAKRLNTIELKVFTVAATVSMLLSIAWFIVQQYFKK